MLIQVSLFILSCLAVWYGAGIILKIVSASAQSLKVSAFTMSFFVLGLLTSLPELVIGTTAVYRGDAELMVGNLIGATLVIFLLVIPLLAITGGGVKLPADFSRRNMIASLATIIAPTILIADRHLTIIDGILMVIMYFALFILLNREASLFQKMLTQFHRKSYRHTYFLPKLIFGASLIFFASQQVVSSAESFAHFLGWSPFIIGLLFVSIGTNIPELSIIIRSVMGRQKEVALADYLGSAAGNTLLIGIFTLASPFGIYLPQHSLERIVLMIVSLLSFYIFARSKSKLSRREGFALFALYVIFVVLEILGARV